MIFKYFYKETRRFKLCQLVFTWTSESLTSKLSITRTSPYGYARTFTDRFLQIVGLARRSKPTAENTATL